MTDRTVKPTSDIRRRFERVLGPDRLAQKMAAIFGCNEKEMFRWERTGWPTYTVVVLEFMEICPVNRWPLRLRSLPTHTDQQ